ncbi:MAG TPA: hypothetical protein VFD15_02070 [Clostridia bacterium]|nr:hypothetical protein [Clostridia bacterium]
MVGCRGDLSRAILGEQFSGKTYWAKRNKLEKPVGVDRGVWIGGCKPGRKGPRICVPR